MSSLSESSRNTVAQVKDTFESIILALILAFVFRAFILEAFVIPTGSMAPALYGAHVDHVCSNCGYTFGVGLGTIPNRIKCPNCEWIDEVGERQPPQAAGDRILVLKWPFALGGLLAPGRWDVVVFKAPFASASGGERDGQTNYIKRLIGLPGDVIELVDGDVFRAPGQAVPEPIRDKLLAGQPGPLSAEEHQQLDSILQIVHKTSQAQEALWQVVYDMDFPPTRTQLGITPAWVSPSPGTVSPSAAANPAISPPWTIGARTMTLDAPAGEVRFVRLEGKSFRDDYGYNNGGGGSVVSDLRLKTTVIWHGGEGPIVLQLSKRDELFTMEVRPGDGTGRTLRGPLDGSAASRIVGSPWAFHPWRRDWPVELAFLNVDHQLQVWMDGRAVWLSPQDTFPVDAAWAKRQRYESKAPLVQMGGAGVYADFDHTAVHRDVHYRDAEKISATGRPGWGTRDNPMLLREDEYFVLGDNSPQSVDSRVWWQVGKQLSDRDYRVGTVPADQMIGQAFFVYWPNGYRLLGKGLPLVPNMGQMRWIR